jgi:hypothetical protein
VLLIVDDAEGSDVVLEYVVLAYDFGWDMMMLLLGSPSCWANATGSRLISFSFFVRASLE